MFDEEEKKFENGQDYGQESWPREQLKGAFIVDEESKDN